MATQPAVNPHIFREYDIRGLVEQDLTPAAVAAIGRGFAKMLVDRGGKRLVLGRDCRTSSTVFATLLCKTLNECGVDVVDLGVVPTPLTYFAAHVLPGIDGLWMITGSHNPPEYNGFKIGIGKSTLHGGEIQELRRIVESGQHPSGAGSTSTTDVIPAYLTRVVSDARPGRKLKIVLDAGNGVGGIVARPLFERLGHDVTGMYLEPDGTFPNHHPDPSVEENIAELRRKVVSTKADVGLAFDGDADRLGVIDDQGNILWGDQAMILFSRAVLKEQPGAVIVGEVKCSQTMYDEIEKAGGKAVMWKAGHSLIKAKMKETGAALAGEMSGHLFFQHRWYGFDDGIYAGARLLELLASQPLPLSRLLADVPRVHSSPEIRREVVSEERKFALVKAATGHFQAQGLKTIDVDGIRVKFDDGSWGLVRASNTQPLLVLRFEAQTAERLREIQEQFEATLRTLEAGME